MSKTDDMSCPDWKALAARRDVDAVAEADWELALEHFDRCDRCRAAALDAEPTLLFRALPVLEASPAEVSGIKQAVAALRRSHELERPVEVRRRWRHLRLAAAYGTVLVGATILAGHLFEDGPKIPLGESSGALSVPADAAGAGATTGAEAAADPDPQSIPILEDVDPSFEAPIQMVVADVPVIQAFESKPRDLRFDVQVLRAGATAADAKPAAEVSEEIVGKLRGVLRYDDYQVLAEAASTGREGEDTSFDLGAGYEVSFKLGEVLAGERLRLEGFRVTRRLATADKTRQIPPRELFHATVNLWMTKPLTLVLAQDETSQEALVIAITCRGVEATERVPGADR